MGKARHRTSAEGVCRCGGLTVLFILIATQVAGLLAWWFLLHGGERGLGHDASARHKAMNANAEQLQALSGAPSATEGDKRKEVQPHGDAALLSPPPPAGARWRGNNYVMESGILPYQRCGTDTFAPGSRPLVAHFQYEGAEYDVAFLGMTFWGGTDETGRPTEVSNVSLLLFWQYASGDCDQVHFSGHCFIPQTFPPIHCRVRGASGPAAGARPTRRG